jgi:hypothetical protein
MPRPTRAHGRPGTEVIPTGWAADHRPVLAGTRRGDLALRKPGTTQAWSDADQAMVSIPLPVHFTGTCRVQAIDTQARERVVAGDPETTVDYLITTDINPADTPDTSPAQGDLATVTDTGDPLLDGRVFRVTRVGTGTELFERYLFCTLNG